MNKEELLQFIERIEKLNSDAEAIANDIKEVYKEAEGVGYIPKYIKEMVKLRKKDKDVVAEDDEIIALYREALGI